MIALCLSDIGCEVCSWLANIKLQPCFAQGPDVLPVVNISTLLICQADHFEVDFSDWAQKSIISRLWEGQNNVKWWLTEYLPVTIEVMAIIESISNQLIFV